MLKGKALNVTQTYNAEAQEYLSKAVKLDPKLVEGWVQLGESYWKQGDISDAKNCFEGALSHSKDKVALRNLSMVLRQLGSDAAERGRFIAESVEKAKEALQLDIKDGTSWLILGNAYLSQFFMGGQNPKIVKLCFSAYQQAERDPVANCNPDLHYNRAMAYKYQEDYQLALTGFARALALDPSWGMPKQQERELMQYLTQLHDLMQRKGKLRAKKLHAMVNSIRESDLGPYSGGSYTGANGTVVTLTKCTLGDLQPGVNVEKVVLGKVVCSLNTADRVPFIFCLLDKTSTCFAVTVYNMADGQGVKIGDSVAIAEPFLQIVDVAFGKLELNYKSIRVDSPLVMVVNGRKLGAEKQALTSLSLVAKSE
ncbi:hypothetical protein NP493_447g01045 [Ridgeia piscesae]|uniref:Cell division cycle protein 27 homolog n=1 Tax=Ridgeia piscesae TaxID=27915 RepID=A0AAD9KZP6_RIDPI|nr:hypothetical protein NP493_447g01045 [Ridgeia piscesae]